MGEPITVAIERTVDPARAAEARIWTQAGVDLAAQRPGYLGAGWVRAGVGSDVWYMLYRFADEPTLHAWETSPERGWWLASGREFAAESRVEKRTGIEGWFDAAGAPLLVADRTAAEAGAVAPPRWKQAVTIWLGFFPTNLVFTLLISWLVPPFTQLPILLRVLVTTLALTPVMTYAVLPLVTRLLRRWLTGQAAPPARVGAPDPG